MEPLKCLAVDDEPHALELLEAYVARVPFLVMHKTTTSPWDAINTLQEDSIDLMFLDIQMDELTGLQLLDVAKVSCPVIITSAYSEYAMDGFDYQVSDYLLKPFSFDRFLKAVTKVKNNQRTTFKELPSSITAPKSPDSIFIKGDSKNKFHQVKFQDILYIEGLNNYVQFHCISREMSNKNERIITLQNMKDLETSLPKEQFMRVHRSYIISLVNIREVDGNSIYIGDKTIPIGQSYRKAFLTFLQKG